jgi:hypothetical protein
MVAYRSDHSILRLPVGTIGRAIQGDRMKFEVGDQVVWLHDGQEIPAIVLANGITHEGVEFYHIDVDGQKKHATVSELLAPKKPGFEIRDLAFVLDESRDAIQGEVVAMGIGPKKRAFYQLKFEPGVGHAQSWYSEDEIFTVSNPKKQSNPLLGRMISSGI